MSLSANRIVILGGRGMLGSDLKNACMDSGMDVNVYDLPEFDVTDPDHVGKAVVPGCVVVNCAAYTNVDGAESEKEIADKVNAKAVGTLGEICKEAGAKVIHISTDFVFDGTKDAPYKEDDKANPLSVYGRSKYDGELLLEKSGCQSCIIRVQWTYGKAGSNFVTKILELAGRLDELKVIDDQVGSPTATTEVSGAIVKILSMDQLPRGIYHFAASDYVSRYEMARFIFDKLNIGIKVTPCKSSEFKTAATRPLNSCFDCAKIESVLGYKIESWQGPLGRFLETL